MKEVIQVDVTVLTFLAGTIVPLLTAVITKLRAPSHLKSIVNLAISALAGVVAYGIAHEGAFDVMGLVSAGVTTYLASGVSYQNLWKPTGAALAVQKATAGIGLGAQPEDPPAGPQGG